MTVQAHSLELLQLLLKKLGTLTSEQNANYERRIAVAHDDGLDLDVKARLALATTIGKGFVRLDEANEIKDILRLAKTDQRLEAERTQARAGQDKQNVPPAAHPSERQPAHLKMPPPIWTDSGGFAEQQASALHLLHARQTQAGHQPTDRTPPTRELEQQVPPKQERKDYFARNESRIDRTAPKAQFLGKYQKLDDLSRGNEGVLKRQHEESTKRQQPAIETAAKAERVQKGDHALAPGEKHLEAEQRLERLMNGLNHAAREMTSRKPGGGQKR
jgi:hypothetical protein